MSVQRSALAHVSGHLKFGASTYIYSQQPIAVNLVTAREDVGVDGLGRVRQPVTSRYLEITVMPVEFEHFSTLMTPYATMVAGASIFGDTDVPLVLHGRNGKSYTFHASAPTSFGIVGKTGRPIFNTLTFTAILANNKAPGDAGAYWTEATTTYPGDSNFSKAACITPALAAAWGASPFDVFHLGEGLDIAFALALENDMVDGLGLVDMKFQDCIVNASGVPVGVTAAQLYTAANVDSVLGSQATENDLILSGTGFHFTAYNATLTDPKLAFSAASRVPGQVVWTTNRTLTSGSLNPCFRIAAAAP
ncbi:MAG: hypothetical protein V4662_12085 [Verrucomicrobiota bacterium]